MIYPRTLYFPLLIITLFTFSIVSLKGQATYIQTDSSVYSGVKIADGTERENAQFCQYKKGAEFIKATPYEVNEYGLKNGSVYVARDILEGDSLHRVFLERLYKGATDLLYYRGPKKKRFFIEQDSTFFQELPDYRTLDHAFREILIELNPDCPGMEDAAKLVRARKGPLKEYFERSHSCNTNPFPKTRYGLNLGYSRSRLIPSQYFLDSYLMEQTSYSGRFQLGFFADLPIKFSDYSLHLESLYTQQSLHTNSFGEPYDLDLVTNTRTLVLPVMLRYTLPANRLRPYFEAGAYVNLHLQNENRLYSTNVSGNVAEMNVAEDGNLIKDQEYGLSAGVGLEYRINYRRSIFLGLRYGHTLPLESETIFMNSVIGIQGGVNF